jgi:hypothetical protein
LNKDRGNYDAYNEFLEKLHKAQHPPSPDPRQAANHNHIDGRRKAFTKYNVFRINA